MTEPEVRQAANAAEGSRQGEEPEGLNGQAEVLNRVDHVLAVMSGKGGVGKSSVAAMLAVALRRAGKSVGLLDADITGPSIPRMFGLSQQPGMGPLGIMPVQTATGIKVMSINLLLPKEDDAVIWRGPLIGGTVRQFWSDVYWGDLHTLVIDLPPGTADAPLTVMQSIPLSAVLMVTSPQDLAGMVVRKAASMARALSIPILGLVENMSYAICPACGARLHLFGPSRAEHTAQLLGIPFLGRIPMDPELPARCDAGQVERYDSEALGQILEQVMARMPAEKAKPLFGRTEGLAQKGQEVRR
ncbi:MAG: Mrp/NBP35 family ATP-binding protein [Anaerolineae bacterium]|nr:Mrp/NBP35 family ATP-binding protein [Anaerolineae bacterium]